MIDWIADYYQRIESLPVLSQLEPGEIRAGLPAEPPRQGSGFDGLLADLDRLILPGITHWQHPSFFAYFPANASGPAVLGDLLASGLGIQGMLWATSPAATELETLMLDWLRQLLGLPASFRSDGPGGGVIQHSASDAALVALLAALHRVSGGATEPAGVGDRPLHRLHLRPDPFLGREGLPDRRARLERIAQARRRPGHPGGTSGAPARADRRRRRRRHTPALVVASVGATGTGAVDPVGELAEIAHYYGAWLHVDAAWAGVAAVCPEFRWINAGVEQADSYCTNPHKWLLTNFDCSAFWVADRSALIGALSILPEYLRNAATESGEVFDYRDWQVPLGRRFRALKLWAVLRWYGADGLQAHIRDHVALAAEFASGRGRRPVRTARAAPAGPGDLPAPGRRRGDDGADAHGERLGRAVPDPHVGQRPARAADGDRRRAHRAPPRRGGLDGARGRRRLSGRACC